MIPLERAYLSINLPIIRKEWFTDLLFYFGQAFIWNSVTVYTLHWIFSFLEFDALSNLKDLFTSQNKFFQIAEVIVLSDFSIYWAHRFQHKYDFLWRFHKVHHTAESVDYLAAFREHPLDNIYTRGIETLPAILLGFDLNLIAGFVSFRGLWALFIHSNVNIRLGFLEIILGSPHLHHWHHELITGGNYNYANLSPLMDFIFGTYYNPEKSAEKFGISEDFNHSYINQIITPLLFWKKN